MVRTRDDVLTCARHIHTDALAPIFLTSSVTGTPWRCNLSLLAHMGSAPPCMTATEA